MKYNVDRKTGIFVMRVMAVKAAGMADVITEAFFCAMMYSLFVWRSQTQD